MEKAADSKNLKFGVIGSGGKHGPRLIKYLSEFGKICWVSNGNDNLSSKELVDWVFISSPNIYHYEYALEFINRGINVFLEKPPTLSLSSFENLISFAKQNNVNFYIDDVFLFKNDITWPKQLKNQEIIQWRKIDNKYGALLDRLAYHHLYLLKQFGDSLNDITNIVSNKSKPDFIDFSFEYCGSNFNATYQCGSLVAKNEFLGVSLLNNTESAIKKMLEQLFSGNIDFEKNISTAAWVMRQLIEIKKIIQPRIAVVGAGLFGCTAALELSAAGYQVDLFEKHNEIIQEASAINQYRVHRGYHYPRSDATVSECLNAIPLFMKSYETAIMHNEVTESFYAIASENSKISACQYLDFLKRHNLEYEVVENLPNTDLTVRVREDLFDPKKIKTIITNRLFGSGVTIKYGLEASAEMLAKYDHSVVATYSMQNDFADKPSIYQFELVEKPIFQLPKEYRGRSVVILDGPFLCIDPYSNTPYHVMGNVVHAIHHTNTGYAPTIPPGYESVLNKGIIKNPPMSKVKEFLQAAKYFFPGIEHSTHIGSMFTVRTVLPYRDADDARPTVVDWIAPKTLGIFAGKICHSVAAAQSARNLLDEERM